MATQIASITDTPTDIKADLSLVVDTTYLIQVIGGSSAKLFESSSAPDSEDNSHVMQSGETWTVKVGSDSLYAWSLTGSNRLAVTEAS